ARARALPAGAFPLRAGNGDCAAAGRAGRGAGMAAADIAATPVSTAFWRRWRGLR
nr:hypothetical protein [Tanacetum cinerariifolium]